MNISKTFKMYHNAAVTCVTYLSIGDPYDDPSCIATAAGSMLYAAQAPWLGNIACWPGVFNLGRDHDGTDANSHSRRDHTAPCGHHIECRHYRLGVGQVRPGHPGAVRQ